MAAGLPKAVNPMSEKPVKCWNPRLRLCLECGKPEDEHLCPEVQLGVMKVDWDGLLEYLQTLGQYESRFARGSRAARFHKELRSALAAEKANAMKEPEPHAR